MITHFYIIVDGEIKRPDVTHIAESLLWESQLKTWDIEKNFIGNLRTEFKDI
jgi:hypothetical protein